MVGCRIGVGRVDLTPDRPGPNTGWGPMGRRDCTPPTDPAQRLYATALALEDEDGERCVLVTVDLHCGGLHLWRAAVAASGLDPSRVVVSGSHTHAGPGQRYGGVQYSLAAGPSPFSAWGSHRRLAPLVAEAVRRAIRSRVPGRVAVVRGVVRDAASNRAVPAWRRNASASREGFLTNGPGSAVPADSPLPDRVVDPRVTVLAARADDGSVRAALAWYAVHGTALGATHEHFGADLWGHAAAEVADAGWTVGFGGGSSGDVSPLPVGEDGRLRDPTEHRPTTQGPALARAVGRRIGAAVVDALATIDTPAGPSLGPFSLAVAHELWEPRRSGLPRPMLGMARAGGGVDGHNDLWPEVADGVRSPRYRRRARHAYSEASGQGPKIAIAQAMLPLPLRFGWLFDLLGPTRLPLHVVRVGDHVFATVPGEATTMCGLRVEEAVLAASGASSASVVGYAGDYGDYWVTPEEYLEQRYEGAATIFGRDAGTRLAERLTGLARTGP